MPWIELQANVYCATTTYTGPIPVWVNVDQVSEVVFDGSDNHGNPVVQVRLVCGKVVETSSPSDRAKLYAYLNRNAVAAAAPVAIENSRSNGTKPRTRLFGAVAAKGGAA